MESKYITFLDALALQRMVSDEIQKYLGFYKRIRPSVQALESIEDLIKRDEQREKDGFPKKIKWRRILVGPNKVITVPYVEEEKLIHGDFEPKGIKQVNLANFALFNDNENQEDLDELPGSGEGKVGDVIGEIPLPIGGEGEGEEGKAGSEPGEHFYEELYRTGKELIEKLKLPNLKDKPKKVPTDEYTFELTDRHRKSGQVLDKKQTLKRIVKTNLVLGKISPEDLDPSKMVISPQDYVYKVLSKEKVWKAQAVVFFIRDYSGSMWGKPTESLLNQHLMIYAWLLVQYEKLVTPRFIVHDTEAREVDARHYFTLNSAGGTYIASAYKKINEIVEGEALDRYYNIYIFQGTDGEDGGDGKEALAEIRKILRYVNRMGVTVFKHPYYGDRKTSFEEYIEAGGVLKERNLFRMHIMLSVNVTEEMNIEALKALIAQD